MAIHRQALSCFLLITTLLVGMIEQMLTQLGSKLEEKSKLFHPEELWKTCEGLLSAGNIKVGGIGVINITKQNARHGHTQISCNVFVHEKL